MQIYDFNLAANQSRVIDVVGSVIKVLTATGRVRITFQTGDTVDVLAGQGARRVGGFTRILIQDRTGANNVGTLFIDDGSFIDDRITGQVEVIDGGKARTLAGQSFAWNAQIAGTAANLQALQLWNPIGSGKRCIVKSMNYTHTVAATISVIFSASQLTTLVGTPASKRWAQDAGSSQVYSYNAAGFPAQQGVFGIYGTTVAANQNVDKALQEPAVLLPGQGLHIVANATGTLQGGMEYVEESITA